MVIEGRAIFSLPEPAGSVDAEDVQVVLDTTADEPAVLIEAVGVDTHRKAGRQNQHSRARAMGAGVTAAAVGQNVRRNQVADASTDGPGVLQLFGSGETKERVLDGAPDAAELAVSQNAGNPRGAELPVIAGTNGPEPARAALALGDAQRNVGSRDPNVLVSSPKAAAAATEDIEAGPARRRHNGRGS